MEKRLLQEDVAKLLGVTTDSVTNWENNRTLPMVHLMPRIIKFLGYNPVYNNIVTLGDQVKFYRLINGLSHKALGKILGVHGTTVAAWEEINSKPSLKYFKNLLSLIGHI